MYDKAPFPFLFKSVWKRLLVRCLLTEKSYKIKLDPTNEVLSWLVQCKNSDFFGFLFLVSAIGLYLFRFF